MIKEEIRLRMFLAELDQTLQENVDSMIDEQGNPIEHDVAEETIYNWMMETKEYHLLSSERVKSIIHLFMTDYNSRMCVLKAYNII